MPENERKEQGQESSDWRRRTRRRKMTSAVYAVLFVILLGVLTGLVIAFRQELVDLVSPSEPAKAPKTVLAKAPAHVPEPPKEPAKQVEPPPEKKVEPPSKPTKPIELPPPQEDQARGRLMEAKGLYEDLQFDRAQKKFEEIAGMDAFDGTKKEAADYAKRCATFNLCTRHIEVAEHANGNKKFVEVNLEGRILRGVLVENTATHIVIDAVLAGNPAGSGKSRLPIPKEQLSGPTAEISLAQRQEEFRAFLKKVEGDVAPARSVDFYDVIYASRRLKLDKECVAYLERAYGMDSRLDETLRKELVRRGIERAMLFDIAGRPQFAKSEMAKLMKQLPDFPLAQQEVEALQAKIDAKAQIKGYKATFQVVEKKTAPADTGTGGPPQKPPTRTDVDKEVEVIMIDGPAPKDSRAVKVAGDADKLGREAQGWQQKWLANRSSRDANSFLDKGIAAADKAIDLYNQLARLDSSNGDYWNSRAADLGMMRYQMFKSHTLDLGPRR